MRSMGNRPPHGSARTTRRIALGGGSGARHRATPFGRLVLNPLRPMWRVMAAFVIGIIVASGLAVVGSTITTSDRAEAAPGNPGVPGEPTVLYVEDFENRPRNSNTLLVDYVSDTGMTYTGSSFWTTREACNGFIINYRSTWQSPDCIGNGSPVTTAQNNFDYLTAIPYVLGQVGGLTAAQAVNNAAASSYTAARPDAGPNQIQFRTERNLTLPTANRFVTFSVDAGAENCFSTDPELVFALVDAAGVEHDISNEPINPCTDPRATNYPAVRSGTLNRPIDVRAGRFEADSSILLQGNQLGIIMRNQNGSTNGNDGAYDNIRVLDVTPQLDKSFSPASVPIGGVSTLTFTVTNTKELAEKPGWSGRDVLADGLVVANPTNARTTCGNGSITTSAGSDTIDLAGDLAAGQVSCTFSVDVTSTAPVAGGRPNVFRNCAVNFPDLVGLNPPACAELEFFGTPRLEVSKTSDATVDTRPGDVVHYTVEATNTGDDDYTATKPAIVVDDLSGVLDDATYADDATASVGTAPTFDAPRLSWSGPLAQGETVTIEYSVVVGAHTGDDTMRNVAFAPPTVTTGTPECDPPVDGIDPDTGLPCAETITELPRLRIAKSADRTDLPEVGESVTYTVTVTNPSNVDYTAQSPATFSDDVSDLLDDATFESGSIVASAGTASYDEPVLSWSGPLAAGASATVTYSVTYTGGGDALLENVACVPDSEAPAGLDCDEVTVPAAALQTWKTSTPSSDPLLPGSTIEYTLHFENTGEAPATVDSVDSLADVLDDATVTSEPTSPDGLTATRTGDTIAVTGTVPVGATYTVTYTVTINAEDERGNNSAANFLDNETGGCEPSSDQRPDCTVNTMPNVQYTKSVTPSSTPLTDGSTLTYRVVVTNTGTATGPVSREDVLTDVLDDADVTSLPAVTGSASGTVTASPVVNERITLSGTIEPGQRATITYTVTLKPQAERGDNTAKNFVVPPGDTPTECDPAVTVCTTTPIPVIERSKSVDPVSGTAVRTGDVLTYTLRFENTGDAAGAVSYDDDASGVFDDAELVGAPTSSTGSVTATVAGSLIQVRGTLAAGAATTVTYQVRVLDEVNRGDDILANFLLKPGDPTPTECVPDGPIPCTENPVPELHDWKTVEASETPVQAGTELTYTLHFENRGEGTATVNAVDYLTHVLDDAEVTAEPTSDGLTVSRAGEAISITGSLGAGESATVVYTVTVKADGERGDDAAANFLVPVDPSTGTPPPPPSTPECVPTDAQEPDCTTTLIGTYTATKAVVASSDPVVTGTTLTYTLTFTNGGEADAVVDETDLLEGVLDDATLTTQPTVSDDALTAVFDAEAQTIRTTGTLAAGEVITVTYVVTVNPESERGDNSADNFLVPTPPPGEEPEPECLPDRCTETLIPNVDVVKSVDPAGEPAEAGDVLTYTLTFTNTGEATGAIAFDDDLSGVLDDAAVTSQPVASDAAVTATLDGDTIAVRGPIAAGATVTVTYQVTVGADGERGDNVIDNAVVVPGETPDCETYPERCTSTTVPELHDWKTVDASATPVRAGTELTYTLHFENRGTGVSTFTRYDKLAAVLDDADVTAEPTSESLTVSRSGDLITISGSLEPGESATVVYTVTVRPDGSRGDDAATNFLVPDTSTPTEDCVPTDLQEPDCTSTPIGSYTVTKTATPSSTPLVAGSTVTYTLTFDNQSETAVPVSKDDDLTGVLDDADVTSLPQSSDPALVVSPIIDGTMTITGELAAGQTVTVTYIVTIKPDAERTGEPGSGDNVATNFVLDPGETPPTECDPSVTPCTETPIPNIRAAKSVDPAEGTTVRAGDVLTYTLTFENIGDAVGAVDYTDFLERVLDDADLTGQPESSDDAITAIVDGQTIVISGVLAAGATATVTYQVTVKADGERGDNTLTNVVTDGTPPGEECEEGDPLCTTTVVPEIHDWKTVEASEMPVGAGTELTYTLHFENRGAAAGSVDVVDFLTHVLDDADVTAEPSTEVLSATRNGERISVTGSLEPGQSATVVYTVTVKADGERGDDTAANFLVPVVPGTPPTPPSDPECVPTDEQEPDCTTTPIGSYDAAKSVTSNETPVGTGSILTYTLTFTNDSEAEAIVDETDYLEGVLDDASMTTEPEVSDDALSAVFDADAQTILTTGTLAAGQVVTVTYTVTVKPQADRGDNSADNFVVPTPPPGEEPEPECPGRCTSTPLPEIDAAKSVSPDEGSTVLAGDVVTYTLTFENVGEADGAFEYTDVLSDVIDDGTVTGQPVSSAPGVTATLDGDEIVVAGSIAAGQTVTVTYQVTVKPNGQRGNDVLGNVLVPEGSTPPPPGTPCAEDDPLCTTTLVGELHDWKTVEASETPVQAGTELTYTLHFENRGKGTVAVDSVDYLTHVLDDADVTTEPTSESLTVAREGEVISITGSLGEGESATVVYTVTVREEAERGDDTASNFLVPVDPSTGTPPPPPSDPVCQPTDAQEPDCTTTLIGRYDIAKSVSASTTPVDEGTELTYTLTFDNQSEAAAEVANEDVLTAVLDDATLTSEPVVSDDALTANLAEDGQSISITGVLEPGQTVTVTYVVTVKALADRGDNSADNFLLTPGETPGEECETGDPACTHTPLPEISAAKSVDPASGSTVEPGDVLTYTLTFTNTGEAAGAADRTDHLEYVLDDASWTSGPVVSDPALTAVRDGEDLLVTGLLQPGQTVTVSYSVTVLPDDQRKTDSLTNFLLPPNAPPPGEDDPCEPGTCTTNITPRLVDWKSADPVSGDPIAAGQVVTYTLHFRNDGDAAGAVAKEDVLSGVLDDASLTTAPTASSDALSVSEVTDGRIAITGTLEPGESATVSYSVTVRPYAQQGDHVLGNWLVLPGDPPGDPGACEPSDGEDADCTVHPIGEIAATKSVDPETGTAVEQGAVLTYTLGFRNTGTGEAAVDYTDHLGDVLDDATLTSRPTSDSRSLVLNLNGDTLTIGGSLAGGASATVTYSVTVMSYDRQGNHILDNFLGLSTSVPDEECVADNPLCTSNPAIVPPPLAITGGQLGLGVIALVVLLILGGALAVETARRRRLALDAGPGSPVGTR